ncbi:galanin receptor type 2 isoform X1 [Rhinolophus ferrumequinum]|uniref:galanin receptor type 2 isoform X1 n=1 Tax=Rhinolophus ferrumequinum TaxID=59479 RepID=UPI00140F7DFA|nr:galanin receptor type 2 isoform X1 [Rhinolophus ferrumequinum]
MVASAEEVGSPLSPAQPGLRGISTPMTPEGPGPPGWTARASLGHSKATQQPFLPLGQPPRGTIPLFQLLAPPSDPSASRSPAPAAARLTPPAAPRSRAGRWSPRSRALAKTQTAAGARATIYTLDGWVFGALLCKAVHFLIFLTMHASSFTLAAVSLDRYLAIRYPLHSREMRTPRNALAAIGLIWGLSLLFSGPYLSYYRQSRLANLTVCHPAWSAARRRAMDLCTFVFSYLLPVLVLGLTYARTLHYLWRAVDPVVAGSGARHAKRKVTRMIIIVAALFCLCWLPHHALILCVWFGRFPLTRATYALRILSHLVSYANSCVNPIVYALVSKHFRKGFRKICAGLLRRDPSRASGRVCVVAQGTRSGSVLERESTDLTHLSEVAGPSAPAPAFPSGLASRGILGPSCLDQKAPNGILTVNVT